MQQQAVREMSDVVDSPRSVGRALASRSTVAGRLWNVVLAAALLLGLSTSAELAAQEVDVTGTWNMTVQSQQGTTNPTVTLQQDGQSLTGSYSSQTLGEADVTGSVEGNEVTFSFTASVGGQSIPVTYTATVDGDGMSGNLDLAGQASASFTATRAEG